MSEPSKVSNLSGGNGSRGKSYNQVEEQYGRARETAFRAWRDGRMTVSELNQRIGTIDRIGSRYLNNIDDAIGGGNDWYLKPVSRSVYMARRNNRRG